jgi:hypothetical protein
MKIRVSKGRSERKSPEAGHDKKSRAVGSRGATLHTFDPEERDS